MCDNLHLDSLQQCETPLNILFFSDFNKNILQRGIRQTFKNRSGIAIDYQNPDDLYAIMRVVFINNSGDHYRKVNEQVKYMNTKVIDTLFLRFRLVCPSISHTRMILIRHVHSWINQ